MTPTTAQQAEAKPGRLASPDHCHTSDEPEVFRRVLEPGVNLCVWTRSAAPAAARAVRAILAAPKPLALDMRAPSPVQLAAAILENFPRPDMATATSVRRLADDIAALAGYFAAVADTRHPRVRLTRVEDDCCALFHVDSLRLRLLCTYAGEGTQWVGNEHVRRDQLGRQDRSLDEATRAIVPDPSTIRTLASWHVALLKGRGWSGEEHSGLVHRSAPVPDRSKHRLVLCIDLPNACAC